MGKKVPEPVEHMVAAIMRERKVPRKEAYAIAVGRLQQLGYLKPGTLDLTEEGRKKLSRHYKEPLLERAKKIALATKSLDVEGALAKLRQGRRRKGGRQG